MDSKWLAGAVSISGTLSDAKVAFGNKDFNKVLSICSGMNVEKGGSDELLMLLLCIQSLYEIGKRSEAVELFPQYFGSEDSIPIALVPMYARLLAQTVDKKRAAGVARVHLDKKDLTVDKDSLNLYLTFIEEFLEDDVEQYVQKTYEKYLTVDEERVTDSRDFVLGRVANNNPKTVEKYTPSTTPSGSPKTGVAGTSTPVEQPRVVSPVKTDSVGSKIASFLSQFTSGGRVPILVSILCAVVLFMMRRTPPRSTISL
eukprot:TRINITY_DN12325_c0_g1_i1.p1 TRINITY_DN12325_c0_g1~~TRINITY_DN12325_c0_g1_i1.p1  ORF type:complete len:277 (+),score=33.43 TRINITY_DN12325_c0_g1_i1:62-832(+)